MSLSNRSSFTSKQKTEEFRPLRLLDITLGRFNTNKWERNTFLGSNLILDTTERIISPTASSVGLEPTFPTSAVNISVASTSASDTGAGTGAQTLIVRGLDANRREIDEEITLNGQTPVNTTNTFLRLNDLFVKDAGSNGFNVGNIYASDSADTFTAGVPDTRLYASMEIGDNLSKTMLYSVPMGRTWVPVSISIQSTAPNTNPVTVKFYLGNNEKGGNTFAIREVFYLRGGLSYFDMSNMKSFPEQTDMYITASSESATSESIHITLNAIEKVKNNL